MRLNLGAILGLSNLALGTFNGNVHYPFMREEPEKRAAVCRHPNCMKLTLHNGGYCSAQCCLEHKQLLKKS